MKSLNSMVAHILFLIKLPYFCNIIKHTEKKWQSLREDFKNMYLTKTDVTKINLQNIQAAHAVQYQKNKQPNQQVGRRPKLTFLQRRHRDG